MVVLVQAFQHAGETSAEVTDLILRLVWQKAADDAPVVADRALDAVAQTGDARGEQAGKCQQAEAGDREQDQSHTEQALQCQVLDRQDRMRRLFHQHCAAHAVTAADRYGGADHDGITVWRLSAQTGRPTTQRLDHR